MNDNIGAKFDRAQKNRSRHGIVDDKWHALQMSYLRQRLDVANIAGRISNAFAEHRSCVGVHQACDVVWLIGRGKSDLYPQTREKMGEQGMSCAVELRNGYDILTRPDQVQHGIVQRCLTG